VFPPGLAERIIAVAKARGIGAPAGFDFREPTPDIPAEAVAYLGAWGPGTDTGGSTKIRVVERIDSDQTVHVLRMWSFCCNGRMQPGYAEQVGRLIDGKIRLTYAGISHTGTVEELEFLSDGKIQMTMVIADVGIVRTVLPRIQ
jgi:hypothetical protein